MKGSGPAGAITYADVERRVGEAPAPPERKRAPWLDLAAMRTAIAAAMARSKREIPHYYLGHQVTYGLRAMADAEERVAVARQPIADGGARNQGGRLGRAPLSRFQRVLSRDKFEPAQAVHVGVAIAIRGGGLAAPALHDADQLSLDELMSRLRDLVQRTRAGRIRSSEISDPTITVTSLGERGVEALYGIIYPPQVAIVGFGKTVVRPWVVDDAIGPRSVITITLAADHRVSDGHAGALFLADIGKLLQEPDKL